MYRDKITELKRKPVPRPSISVRFARLYRANQALEQDLRKYIVWKSLSKLQLRYEISKQQWASNLHYDDQMNKMNLPFVLNSA